MQLFEPLVSIVIPVFNGSNYMREAIDSALAQTYKNIEVIVVNDGSRDNDETDAIAKSYGKKIRYFSKENGGCASALNLGIEKMRGDYFSWLSHDDVYFPEKIEHQIRVLADLANKDTILYGGYEVIDAQSKLITTVRPDAVQPVEKLDIPLFPLLRGLIHGCSMLVPARYFREVAVFDEGLPSTQDYALWFQFLRVAPLHYDPRILIRSRVHPEQGTHKIAKHIEECNELWSGFLTKLTSDEMTAMEGTPFRFLVKTAQFLANTPYKEAQRLAASMADAALSSTLVSVIIPFHNRVDWTIEAIRSVQAQTHQSFEIILVDDGSTDSLDALQDLLQSDQRVIYVRQNNSGAAKARNTGVTRAAGRYIAFLDSDDLFVPEKLERQLRYMEEHGFHLSHTSYERIDSRGEFISFQASGVLSGIVFPRIIYGCPIAMPTVMGKTDLFKKHSFPEHIDIGEDVCLWIKLTSIYELGGINENLSKVRVGLQTASMNTQKQIVGRLNIASYVAQDSILFQYGLELRLLLKGTLGLVPADDGPAVLMAEKDNFRLSSGLFFIVLKYLRRNGLRATFRRARLHLGF